MNKNILIIGMSKMGKTHFGGQLYGRLKSLNKSYKLRKTPDDLSLFEEILERLNDGLEGSHTSTKLNEAIVLPIQSQNGTNPIDIIYPDYGGEQIRGIVEQREIPIIWKNQIEASNHWFLFIRLDLMEKVSDVTTKFHAQIDAEKINNDEDKERRHLKELPENSSAFYIELLQIFLYTKFFKATSKDKPQLTVLLSCWDKLESKYGEGILPSSILSETMPLFFAFISSNWKEDQYQIIGLSSLGKDLSKDKADKDYQIQGPEKFGYLVMPDGKREPDITQIFNAFVL